mgnify:CR=1 FL=1
MAATAAETRTLWPPPPETVSADAAETDPVTGRRRALPRPTPLGRRRRYDRRRGRLDDNLLCRNLFYSGNLAFQKIRFKNLYNYLENYLDEKLYLELLVSEGSKGFQNSAKECAKSNPRSLTSVRGQGISLQRVFFLNKFLYNYRNIFDHHLYNLL